MKTQSKCWLTRSAVPARVRSSRYSNAVCSSGVIENVTVPVRNGEAVTWEPDERRWITLVLRELRQSGEHGGYLRLVELVERAEALLRQADHDELTKEQLLVRFQQAEQAMTDPVSDRITATSSSWWRAFTSWSGMSAS